MNDLERAYCSIDKYLLTTKKEGRQFPSKSSDEYLGLLIKCFQEDFGFQVIGLDLVKGELSYDVRRLFHSAVEYDPVSSVCRAAMELDGYFAELSGIEDGGKRLDHVMLNVILDEFGIGDREREAVLAAKGDLESFCGKRELNRTYSGRGCSATITGWNFGAGV